MYADLVKETHIDGATVQLIGTTQTWPLQENQAGEYYALSIDTEDLGQGVKFLTLLGQKTNFEPVSVLIKVTVRQKLTNITTVSGVDVASIRAGTSYFLQIKVTDLDFNRTIINATVTYSWQGGEGVLTDDDDDGVYEGWIDRYEKNTGSL